MGDLKHYTANSDCDSERMDMFEFMAKQRFYEVHKKREIAIHEYITREPLRPEIVLKPVTPPPQQSSFSCESREYLNESKIVQTLRTHWESWLRKNNSVLPSTPIKVRNPCTPPATSIPVPVPIKLDANCRSYKQEACNVIVINPPVPPGNTAIGVTQKNFHVPNVSHRDRCTSTSPTVENGQPFRNAIPANNCTQFQQGQLKKYSHQRPSVEGLFPATQHPPEVVKLTHPILDSLSDISKDLPPCTEYETDSFESRDLDDLSDFETSSGAFTVSSSIALEMEGLPIKRATTEDNDFLLFSADFNEMIQEEFDTQSAHIYKAKSESNMSCKELKAFVKCLSEAAIRNGTVVTPHNLHSFHICHKCKRLIKPGDATFQFQNGYQNVWHRECFVCKTCQNQLGYMDHLFFEDEPYCLDHYVIVAHVPKCHACEGLIFDPLYTSAAGYFWHKEHFTCYGCCKPLVDTKYVYDLGHVYCFSCHQKEFVRVCRTCQGTILPTESFVQSGNHLWHSNDTCLHCQTCGRSLVGQSLLFRKAGFLYCNRYCALGRDISAC